MPTALSPLYRNRNVWPTSAAIAAYAELLFPNEDTQIAKMYLGGPKG
jgi:hypothetical protein